MATITVVSPKTITPGPGAFFMQLTEANSTTLAALRWVVFNSTPRWAAYATDGTTIAGSNVVAGANATSGLVATDVQVYVPGMVLEANSNSTGTDPLIGTQYDLIVSANAHQVDTLNAVTTAASATNLGTAVAVMLRLSPKDTSLDTNIRMWFVPKVQHLQYVAGY